MSLSHNQNGQLHSLVSCSTQLKLVELDLLEWLGTKEGSGQKERTPGGKV